MVESLVTVLASPPLEEPQEQVLARPQTKAPLKDVRPPPQLVESLVSVLVTPLPEEPRRLGFHAGRRACSSSTSRVTGTRACLPSARGAPAASASSPSDGGAAGRRACCLPSAPGASACSPSDEGAAERRASSSSASRVAGERASHSLAGGAPETASYSLAGGAPETGLSRPLTEALLETVSVVPSPHFPVRTIPGGRIYY